MGRHDRNHGGRSIATMSAIYIGGRCRRDVTDEYVSTGKELILCPECEVEHLVAVEVLAPCEMGLHITRKKDRTYLEMHGWLPYPVLIQRLTRMGLIRCGLASLIACGGLEECCYQPHENKEPRFYRVVSRAKLEACEMERKAREVAAILLGYRPGVKITEEPCAEKSR